MKHLVSSIQELQRLIPSRLDLARKSEAATKQFLVAPLIEILGYDMRNPSEVIPEFVADVLGRKRGEKVDYAIFKGKSPTILIECKVVDSELSQKGLNQLFRYFTSTSARFGILTDGLQYRCYSDLDEQNIMDESPFMEINLIEDAPETIARNLVVFTKSEFDQESVIKFAKRIRYKEALKPLLAKHLEEPSSDFASFVLNKVVYREIYKGSKTKAVKEFFVEIISEISRELIGAPDPIPIPIVNGGSYPKQWTSLAEFDVQGYMDKNKRGNTAHSLDIRFWNGKEVTLGYWKYLPLRTAEQLHKDGILTAEVIPCEFSRSRFITHTDKNVLKGKGEILAGTQLYVDTDWGAPGAIRCCKVLLEKFGKDPNTDMYLKDDRFPTLPKLHM